MSVFPVLYQLLLVQQLRRADVVALHWLMNWLRSTICDGILPRQLCICVFGVCVSPQDKVNCYQNAGCRRDVTSAQICLNSPQYKTNKRNNNWLGSCSSSHVFEITIAHVRNAVCHQLHILNFKYIQRGREEDSSCFPAAEGRHFKQVFYLLIFFFFFFSSFQRHICADEPLFPRRTSGTLSTMCDNSQPKVQRFVLFSLRTDHFPTF